MKHTGLRIGCIVFVLAFAHALPALADCTAHCSEDIGCYGECSISETEGCGTICYASCSYTCKLIGPARFNCTEYVSNPCDRRPPPTFASLLEREWAVVDVWTDGRSVVGTASAKVAAASSPAFAASAVLRAVGQENDWIAQRRAAAQSKGVEFEELFAGDEPWRSTTFSVDSAGEPGIAVEAELASRKFPFDVERGTAVYFRAITDAASNQVIDVDVLYSRKPELEEAFVEFIKEHMQVGSRRNPSAPLEFYGVVGIAGKEPGVWFAVTAATELRGTDRFRTPGHRDSSAAARLPALRRASEEMHNEEPRALPCMRPLRA